MNVLDSVSDKRVFILQESDKVRLERLAPHFGIEFTRTHDGVAYICISESGGTRTVTMPESQAHMRLLTEVCAKCVNWVYFRAKEHCGQTLLSLSDVKIRRIAELYGMRRMNEEKSAHSE